MTVSVYYYCYQDFSNELNKFLSKGSWAEGLTANLLNWIFSVVLILYLVCVNAKAEN